MVLVNGAVPLGKPFWFGVCMSGHVTLDLGICRFSCNDRTGFELI